MCAGTRGPRRTQPRIRWNSDGLHRQEWRCTQAQSSTMVAAVGWARSSDMVSVWRAQRVEEAETDSVALISRTELKHKARNIDGSGSSVTGNGVVEHWSRDKAKRHICQAWGLERRAALKGDKHGFGKFHAMLMVDSTYHVRSKGQTKGYGPTVYWLESWI